MKVTLCSTFKSQVPMKVQYRKEQLQGLVTKSINNFNSKNIEPL